MNAQEIIKKGQLNAIEKLHLFNVNNSLRPILLLASYCGGDNPKCTDTNPCETCIGMCNIAFIDNDAIKLDQVVCGRDFIEDYR